MYPASRRLAVTLAALGVFALTVAGCGSSGGGSAKTTTTAGGPNASVAAKVPADIKAKGSITLATSADYPPIESVASDGKTIVGLDPDLAHAIGGELGLQVKLVNAPFDGILPGLGAGKYDLAMSGFGDTKEREKTVDFVTYYQAGASFFVKADGGPTINTLADLCGHTVAVEKGTTEQTDAQTQAKKCKAQGKPEAKVLVFPDQNGANLALSTGRADVSIADSPIALYQVHQSGGQFKVVGKPYGVVPYGIAFPKGSALAPAVLAALQDMFKSGEYTRILSKMGLQPGAVASPQLNGATS